MIAILRDALLAMVATVGFAMLFNAPRKTLWLCGLIGGTAHLTRSLFLMIGVSANLAMLLGGMLIGLLGELGARRLRVPALIFMVTGFVPLVPGALSYRTVLAFLDGNYNDGLANGLQTALLGGALAIGIGVVRALFRVRSRKPYM